MKSGEAERPRILGILNVTPDSFSDGGRFRDAGEAVAAGERMFEEGADIVDVGGESTRPGSRGVSVEEELERVLPVIRGLARRARGRLSIDTTKPEVAAAALDAGATIVNDVSTLRGGDELARAAAAAGAELVIMHSRKTPADMQVDVRYDDLLGEVRAELAAAAERAAAAGVPPDRIWVDPGIGFAKTAEMSVELLARTPEIAALGYRVLVGPSRKSFIGALTGAPVEDRLGGTAAAVTAAVLGGADAVRVHDVRVMRQAVEIAVRMRAAAGGGTVEGGERV